MRNPRIDKLAKLLINHSCSLKPSERVLIETIGIPREMIIALVREAKKVGATPIVSIKDDRIIRELCICYNEDDVKLMADCKLYGVGAEEKSKNRSSKIAQKIP